MTDLFHQGFGYGDAGIVFFVFLTDDGFHFFGNAIRTEFAALKRVIRYLILDEGTDVPVFGNAVLPANSEAKLDNDVVDAV